MSLQLRLYKIGHELNCLSSIVTRYWIGYAHNRRRHRVVSERVVGL